MNDFCSKETFQKFLDALRRLGKKLVQMGVINCCKNVAYLLACSRSLTVRKQVVQQLKYNSYSNSFCLQLYQLKNRVC